MTKYTVYALMAFVICMSIINCGETDTILDVQFFYHPIGGYDITEVDCAFTGELIQGNEPITAYVEWWWEDAYGSNDQMVWSGYYIFDSDEPELATTYFSAPTGYILLNYYWVKIHWTNEDGSSREIESNKAYCHD